MKNAYLQLHYQLVASIHSCGLFDQALSMFRGLLYLSPQIQGCRARLEEQSIRSICGTCGMWITQYLGSVILDIDDGEEWADIHTAYCNAHPSDIQGRQFVAKKPCGDGDCGYFFCNTCYRHWNHASPLDDAINDDMFLISRPTDACSHTLTKIRSSACKMQ